MRPQDPDTGSVDAGTNQFRELRGPECPADRDEVGDHGGALVVSSESEVTNEGADIVGAPLPLSLAFDEHLVGGEHALEGDVQLFDQIGARAPTGQFPRRRRDALLERPVGGVALRDRHDIHPGRQRGRQGSGQFLQPVVPTRIGGVETGVARQVEVDVFGERFGCRRQRQAESDLGSRGESFGVRHWKIHSTQGTLPQTSTVAVADEADLAQLRVLHTKSYADVGLHVLDRSALFQLLTSGRSSTRTSWP